MEKRKPDVEEMYFTATAVSTTEGSVVSDMIIGENNNKLAWVQIRARIMDGFEMEPHLTSAGVPGRHRSCRVVVAL